MIREEKGEKLQGAIEVGVVLSAWPTHQPSSPPKEMSDPRAIVGLVIKEGRKDNSYQMRSKFEITGKTEKRTF